MSSIPCIFLEPSEFAEVTLRRYSSESCSGHWSYHNASALIGTVPYPHSDYDGEGHPNHPHDDPRWPAKCMQCEYVFKDEDVWQHNTLRLYQRTDHVALKTALGSAPVGSMWYADWYPWKGPDGHCLIVKTPAGDWIVDAPSYVDGQQTGTPWTRTGTPPFVTASPSIHFPGKYHGWLQNGVLVEC